MIKNFTAKINLLLNKIHLVTSSNKTSKALYLLSFAESIFFPIPVDPLLAVCIISKPTKVIYLTLITITASVLGGVVGWYLGFIIGFGLEPIMIKIPGITINDISNVKEGFSKWNILLVFIGAFTPLPYKIIAITSGATGVPLIIFFIGSVVGRGIRFSIVAIISFYFGQIALDFIKRKLALTTTLLGIIIIISWFILI